MIANLSLYLRAATRLDVVTLARLRVASALELGLLDPSDAPTFEASARRAFRELFASDRIVAWIAVLDDVPVGCACALFWTRLPYPEGSVHAEIAGIYVAPHARGRGLASELTREVVATARARGVRKTVLHPTPRAAPLYRRLGFVDGNELVLAPEALGPSRAVSA